MTRRRFYAPPEAFAPDRTSVTLSAEETRHLRDVLRLTMGDVVHVFDGEGREFRCEISEVARDSAQLNVIEEADAARPESPLKLTLAVALLKGERFDLVVQKATELGITSMIPIITSRADVKIKSDDEAGRKIARWRRIVLEATKQCGRAHLMKIEAPINFANLISDRADTDELRLMFAERAGDLFENALEAPAARQKNVLALIGPEGGFSDDEIDQAREAGWMIITLGGRVMRAETAAIAITSLLQHRFGDLK